MRIFAENLLFHELLHFFVGFLIAIFVYKRFKSIKLVVFIFLVTFFIDADHLTEGFLVNGWNFQWLLDPLNSSFFKQAGKMTIFFHNWEVLPIILYLGKRFQRWPMALTVAVSAMGHYLVDQSLYTSLYGMSLLQYSLIYRAWHNFNFWELCGGC